ncbi:MAG: 3-deoxy-manno-octulosonate cytidylyltransferase [Candidatus Latescibacteria bacterium]|nr:3-deoxy-manno-octulosonate cytidylyltransferase [Candidatus Latescibacterota bacterium]
MPPVVIGIIPARYGSTRFPGKPLAGLCGKPMIQHVYEQARRAECLANLIVATDDERILMAVQAFGGQAVLTAPGHVSGTDRAAEVAHSLDADIIVNIQGDEPFITPEAIQAVVRPLVEDDTIPMSTLAHRIDRVEHLFNPHMGKVVVDDHGMALYFSRSPIPHPTETSESILRETAYYNTVGLYGYRREFLLTFARLLPTPLERAERLEQLRALEHGYRIKVVETEYAPLGVDTPEDLAHAAAMIRAGERAG